MGARTAIKAIGRRVGDVRYIGRLARITAAVWRTPYTAATLYELKESINHIASSQQNNATLPIASNDAALQVKLDAIADGYGSALTGVEKALRLQDRETVSLRSMVAAHMESIRVQTEQRNLILDGKLAQIPEQLSHMQAKIAALQAELAHNAAASFAAVGALQDEVARVTAASAATITALQNKVATNAAQASDTISALEHVIEHNATLSAGAIAALQNEAVAHVAASTMPSADLSLLKQQSTDINNTVASIVEKVGWISVDNDNIRARLEFIRTEVMFELRKQMQLTQATVKSSNDPTTTQGIINYEKVSAAGPKRLNLGSGHVPKDGYINVDFRAVPGVDVVGDVTALEFQHGTIDAIFASHLIEHFPVRALHDVVLPHWRNLLRPGGELVLIAPDGAAMLEAYKDGVFNFDELREVLYGGQEYEGDFHFNMLSPASAEALLIELGFTAIRIEAAGRRNGNCLEFEIHAEKPLS